MVNQLFRLAFRLDRVALNTRITNIFLLKTPCGRRTAAPLSFLNSACCGEHFLKLLVKRATVLVDFRSQKCTFGLIFGGLWGHFGGPEAVLAAMGAGVGPEACQWRSVGAIFGGLGARLRPKGDPRVAFWRSKWG